MLIHIDILNMMYEEGEALPVVPCDGGTFLFPTFPSSRYLDKMNERLILWLADRACFALRHAPPGWEECDYRLHARQRRDYLLKTLSPLPRESVPAALATLAERLPGLKFQPMRRPPPGAAAARRRRAAAAFAAAAVTVVALGEQGPIWEVDP